MKVYFLCVVLLGVLGFVTAQSGCVIQSESVASASGESVIQTATATALASAIADVQSGAACAQAAADAVAQVTANSTAQAAAEVFASVPEGCNGEASAFGTSFANSTATAIATAVASAFATVMGVAEAESLATAVSTDVQSAIATATAEAISTGGVAQGSAEALSDAVAAAVASAYAEAFASFNSDECNGVLAPENFPILTASNPILTPGDAVSSIDTSGVMECKRSIRPCRFRSIGGSGNDCCQVDLSQTLVSSICEGQQSITEYNYKGLCLKQVNGELGTYALVLGRSFPGSSISLNDCICEETTLQANL
eukprot:TRINITY_DN1093_c0_g1_i2.p1 TRINITY_DN1093_c0_g1~~TRINITY_DN1093_c0_g1_i2.p1  ORF type:complete len:364 (+),score=70.35 TRINITY_DN1093_c0_g1_i2:158-1093(+)